MLVVALDLEFDFDFAKNAFVAVGIVVVVEVLEDNKEFEIEGFEEFE